MSHDTEESLDDIARELQNEGEVTLTFDLTEGQTLDGPAGVLTALAEMERFEAPPSEVEIRLQR